MRTRRLAALVAIIAGGLWVATSALSWGETGLTEVSEQLWWGALGAFALASALTGYASVTRSPIWLRGVVFLGAGALGAGVVGSFDTGVDQAYAVIGGAGVVALLAGLVGLLAGPRSGRGREPRGGHRAKP